MDAAAIHQHGGIVTQAQQSSDEAEVIAFSSTHPNALGGRVVVRVIPEQLEPAEIMIQELLGLEKLDSQPVGAALPRALGFPEGVILNDPENARHALNIVADLEWARRMARGAKNKVATRFDDIALNLIATVPHFVPPLFEEVARIFDMSGSQKYATRYFGKARETERSYGLAIEPKQHQQVMTEFARRGLISAKELTAESAVAASMFDDPEMAYTYFYTISMMNIQAGNPPSAHLIRDLTKLGKAAGKTEIEVATAVAESIVNVPSFHKASPRFVIQLSKKLKTKTKSNIELISRLFTQRSEEFELQDWLRECNNFGVLEFISQQPEQFHQWVENILQSICAPREWGPEIAQLIDENHTSLKHRPLRVYLQKLDLSLLSVFSNHEIQLEVLDGDEISIAYLENLLRYAHSADKYLDVDKVFRNEELCKRIIQGWDISNFISQCSSRLNEIGGQRLIEFFLQQKLHEWSSPMLLPACKTFATSLNRIRKTSLSKNILEALEEQTNISVAEIMVRNLRAGLLTEFTWPELEKHVQRWGQRIKPDLDFGPKVRFANSYPGVVALFKNSVVAVEGDVTLATATVKSRQEVLWAQYFGPEHEIMVVSRNKGREYYGEWSDGTAAIIKYPMYSGWHYERVNHSVPCGDGRVLPFGFVNKAKSPIEIPDFGVSGNVFTTRSGKLWSYDADEVCHTFDLATGQDLGTVNIGDIYTAFNADETLDLVNSTLLTAPDSVTQECIVPSHNGNFIFAIRRESDQQQMQKKFCIQLGDGRSFFVNETPVGMIEGAGLTLAISCDGALISPERVAQDQKLAYTLDSRGAVHWLHALPFPSHHNLQVRNAQASQVLRTIRNEQVQKILDAIDLTLTKTAKRTKTNIRLNEYTGPYNPVDGNCLPDAPAMRATSELLGCDDPELCASVVQVALQAHKLATSLAVTRKYLHSQRVRQQTLGSEKSGQVEKPATNISAAQEQSVIEKPITVISREMTELRAVIEGTLGKRSKRWSWVPLLRNEKSFLLCAQGVLAPPAIRSVMTELLSEASDAGFLGDDWHQVLVNWQHPAKQYGKSRLGLSFQIDNNSKGYVIGRGNNLVRVLVKGDRPSAVAGQPTEGVVSSAASYSLDPKITVAAAQQWIADYPDGVQVDLASWRQEMQPYIDVIVSGSVLTENAATVLLAGGFHPELPQLQPKNLVAYNANDWARFNSNIDDVKKYIADARKQLKITLKAHTHAIQQLEAVNPEVIELMMIAVFDRNLAALEKVVESIPTTLIDLDDAAIDVFLSWPASYFEQSVNILWKAASPLPQKVQLKNGSGYGRLAGIVLHWAIRAEGNDPLRSFYADQLEAIKTIPDSALQYDGLTEYPLQWVVEESARNTYWNSNIYSADAVRALKEGYFDAIIDDLRKATDTSGCVFDPRNSAPSVVAEVQQALGLNESAAAYYLQLLALVDCTDRNIKLWNNWKKRDLDQARATLVEHQLVVEGTRSRAGRSVFLPGAWWPASAPNMPFEAWKAEHYLIRYDTKAVSVVPWCPPLLPAGQLFAAVWQRYSLGDKPQLEELSTKNYRKRR